MTFRELCDAIARDVCARLPTAKYQRAATTADPATIQLGTAKASLWHERTNWRVSFTRDGRGSMSGLAGEQHDAFIAGNLAQSITTFLEL